MKGRGYRGSTPAADVPPPASLPSGNWTSMADETLTRVSYGEITVVHFSARTVVYAAPGRSLISLAVLAHAAPERIHVSEDRLYLGNDRNGVEVIYQVTGWDPEHQALIVERVA